MPATQAFFILLLCVAFLALAVWLLLRGWSPEQLPLWAGLIWGLMALMVVVPALLPPSIRWSDALSVVQMMLGLVVLVLSVKCLILLLRHGGALSVSQRWAAWLGLAPLIIGVFLVLVLFWSAGFFSSKK